MVRFFNFPQFVILENLSVLNWALSVIKGLKYIWIVFECSAAKVKKAKAQNFSVTLRTISFNPLRPNNDLTQTSHCNIKALSGSEVMRIEIMITQVKVY